MRKTADHERGDDVVDALSRQLQRRDLLLIRVSVMPTPCIWSRPIGELTLSEAVDHAGSGPRGRRRGRLRRRLSDSREVGLARGEGDLGLEASALGVVPEPLEVLPD